MKIAIVGSGPSAILAASHFDQLGASVTLFQRSPLGGNLRFLLEYYPDFKIHYRNREIGVGDFFEEVIVPRVQELEKYNLTKLGEVLRVHKRFLHPDENVPGRTRMHDLFRVVYSMNPKETILKQLEENPEFFKQLGEDVIRSLHLPVESFEDFDVVIEAQGLGRSINPMGAGKSLALNENNLRESSLLFYEKDIFTKLDLASKKTLVLVGEGISLKLALLKLKDWLLLSSDHQLFWVTHQDSRSSSGLSWLDSEVEKMLSEINARFNESKAQFETKLREWRDLEDYVKVKVPKPIEPVSPLVIYQGYDVTSVDRLLDREGVFATIESPDFRSSAEKTNDMLTLAADAICIARGVRSASEESLADQRLKAEEPGYYVMSGADVETAEKEIQFIENDILKFFKKA